jgi:hypothetical protein
MIASVGVVHDINTNTQKIYGGKQVAMTQKTAPGSD